MLCPVLRTVTYYVWVTRPPHCVCHPHVMPQVQQFSWAALQQLVWPTGEPLMTVAEALAQVQQAVRLVIVDVKASADVSRVSAG